MKWKQCVVALLVVAISTHAQGNCGNAGTNDSGTPTQSCHELLSSYNLGLQASDGVFFLDSGIDIKYNNKTYRLRFFVTPADSSYNQIQALAQTGYATRSKVSVIYPNYFLTNVGNANTTALNNTNCSTNSDALGNPANMYCPIQALSILE